MKEVLIRKCIKTSPGITAFLLHIQNYRKFIFHFSDDLALEATLTKATENNGNNLDYSFQVSILKYYSCEKKDMSVYVSFKGIKFLKFNRSFY